MTGSSLRVLAYHRIADVGETPAGNPSIVSATPEAFERQMQHLLARYRVVPLSAVLEAQRGGTPLPPRAVLITFDDGYRDFGEVAWPILRRYGLPATVFVATAFATDPQRLFWWERLHHAVEHASRPALGVPGLGTLRLDSEAARRSTRLTLQAYLKQIPHGEAMALVERLSSELAPDGARAPQVLGWPQLRRLKQEGVFLVAHTRTHPALTQLSRAGIREEIRGSMDDLERELGDVPPVFCCPFGLYDQRVLQELERQSVEMAFTCEDGHNRVPSGDPLRLRRTSITPRTTPFVFPLRLLRAVSRVDRWRHDLGRL
jgi:peptidoglycan/xylan/chitin deacetylase (PgdA/CDA1 family)